MTASEFFARAGIRIVARDIWHAENNAGNGFAPELAVVGEQPDVNELSAEFGTLVHRADYNTDVAIYRADNGDAILVGDAHGPWCVRVRS